MHTVHGAAEVNGLRLVGGGSACVFGLAANGVIKDVDAGCAGAADVSGKWLKDTKR